MAVPNFQSMFIPLLQFAADGKEHRIGDVIEHIGSYFNLSQEEREELLPSGAQRRVNNRVGWARTHLKHAGLVEYVRRGVLRITSRGREVLDQNREAIDLKFLDQYPEHLAWRTKAGGGKPNGGDKVDDPTPPEEQIASLVKDLQTQLADDLLDEVGQIDPFRFEQLVVDLLLAMGYGGSREEAASVTKHSNDEGIDGIINEDRLGLDVIYVQAKRWKHPVGRKEIQSFVGALAGKQANKGVFITTSQFAETASEYAQVVSQKVVLIDGTRMASLMIEHGIGVSTAETHVIRKIDGDYFEDS